ncbi:FUMARYLACETOACETASE [Salix viminalis]|uniref:Fumarylacetoacetase n=1 Tax=Salix viminalis TaxID=40686 RepID=A0A9Q0ZP09_SALVM|nr:FUMARYLACETOACETASE [Salix viminalis]
MALKSFIEVSPDSHFPIQNLPFGIFKPEPASPPRPGVAIGDYVLDLSAISVSGIFDGPVSFRFRLLPPAKFEQVLSVGKASVEGSTGEASKFIIS